MVSPLFPLFVSFLFFYLFCISLFVSSSHTTHRVGVVKFKLFSVDCLCLFHGVTCIWVLFTNTISLQNGNVMKDLGCFVDFMIPICLL